MSETHYLVDALILLAAAVLTVPIFQRLRLGAVLGFLAAGVMVGPGGLGLISDREEIRHLAEFGVVLLLFVIGIGLKPSRLWVMRHSVFGLGTAQLLLTGLLFTWMALLFEVPTRTAIVVGFGLALSSTAFGLQILTEKGDLGTAYGRSAFAILLLQDLAVVPLIALVPLLAQEELSITQDLELVVLETVLILFGILVASRFLVRPLLGVVASGRSPEVFTATTMLLVLGTAWLTQRAGLSMALGAFLAGLLLSDSRYRHQIMADIRPFRGILMGLFFMTVGISIDFGSIGQQGMRVVGLVIGVLLIKGTLLWALCRGTGRSPRQALAVSLLLSQGGEFGFILFGLAHVNGVMESELYRQMLLVIALSMAATPLLVMLTPRVDEFRKETKSTNKSPAGPPPESSNHVILAGFGRFGQRVAKVLARSGTPYVALDVNPQRVTEGRYLGYPVYFGDACDIDVLRSAGVDRAVSVVFALDQIKMIEQGLTALRESHPDLPVYSRARDFQQGQRLCKMGASDVFPETLDASLRLGLTVLRATGVSQQETDRLEEEFHRQDHERLTRTAPAFGERTFSDILFLSSNETKEQAALAAAVTLSDLSRARLTVAGTVAEPSTVSEQSSYRADAGKFQGGKIAERQRRLEELVTPLRERRDVQVSVLVGAPVLEVARDVLNNERDLVIKAKEGWVDIDYVRRCPCPLLLVDSANLPPFRRVLAAVDVEEFQTTRKASRHVLNRRVLEVAASLSLSEAADLHLVHAWEVHGEEVLRSGRSPYRADADAYVASAEKRHRDAVNRLLAAAGKTIGDDALDTLRTKIHLVKGDPREGIIRLARDQEVDLVVLGTKGYAGIGGYIMGSIAEDMAHRLDCSVLVVKRPGFVAPGDIGV